MNEAIPDRTASNEIGGIRPPNAFGDIVRRLREARDLTQTALAARMQQSVSYISLIESGRRKPTPRVIANLLSALNLSPAEEAELQAAAGVPTSPLDNAIHQCILALAEATSMDAYDRRLVRQDLTAVLNGWKETLLGKREMESGRFETAQEAFLRVTGNPALTPMELANAHIRLADIQEKQGEFKHSEESIRRAQAIVQLQDPSWGVEVRAEISGTQGFIAARAGESHVAQILSNQGKRFYTDLQTSAKEMGVATPTDTEAIIVASVGIANASSRLALRELFAGNATKGLYYAQEGLNVLPAAPQRDVARARLRLQGLEAWALAQQGKYDEAHSLRESVRREFAALGDDYGVAKSLSYLADDCRLQVESLLNERDNTVVTPTERRSRIAELRKPETAGAFRALLDNAISNYRDSISTLRQVGDRILLAHALRNMGDMLRYRWLLDGAQQDHDDCELLLNQALSLENKMNEGAVHTGRRLPNVYESLAKLAWDEGAFMDARDNYAQALSALETPQVTTTDHAGENLRARIEQALSLLNTKLQEKPAAPVGAPATATKASHGTASTTVSGTYNQLSQTQERSRRRVIEQFEQLVIPTLRALAQDGIETCADTSERWATSLCDLEKQDGPRILAQRRISTIFLSTTSLESASEEAMRWRNLRRTELIKNIEQAKESGQYAFYRDICWPSDVEEALRATLRGTEAAYFNDGLELLRSAGDVYYITPIPFDLPIEFAIKGKLLLIEAPEKLAREQLGVTLDEPSEFVCFRIEGQATLMHQMSDIFAQLRGIGQAAELNGAGAANWLRRLHEEGVALDTGRRDGPF
jgi:transcriptional regulator with XRE-family HTH domain